MNYISDSYNTKDWTNVVLKAPMLQEHWDWLKATQGGFFHVHRSGTEVKFENKADAELFREKWS